MAPRLTESKLTKAADDLFRAASIVERQVSMLTRVTANPKSRDAQLCRELAKHRESLRVLRASMDRLEQHVRSCDGVADQVKLRDELSVLAGSLVAVAEGLSRMGGAV